MTRSMRWFCGWLAGAETPVVWRTGAAAWPAVFPDRPSEVEAQPVLELQEDFKVAIYTFHFGFQVDRVRVLRPIVVDSMTDVGILHPDVQLLLEGVQAHPKLELEPSFTAADWILVIGDSEKHPFAGNLSSEQLAKVVRYDLNDRMPEKPPAYVGQTSRVQFARVLGRKQDGVFWKHQFEYWAKCCQRTKAKKEFWMWYPITYAMSRKYVAGTTRTSVGLGAPSRPITIGAYFRPWTSPRRICRTTAQASSSLLFSGRVSSA